MLKESTQMQEITDPAGTPRGQLHSLCLANKQKTMYMVRTIGSLRIFMLDAKAAES